MENNKVTAVLWCFVGVALVCFFAALVSVRVDDSQWSHVRTPTVTNPHPFIPMGK